MRKLKLFTYSAILFFAMTSLFVYIGEQDTHVLLPREKKKEFDIFHNM